jgi:hypothetical protein
VVRNWRRLRPVQSVCASVFLVVIICPPD